jgi:hypothetical protein
MRRVQIFIIIFTVSLSVIIGLLAVGVYLATAQPSQYSSSWIGQMWSGMGNSGNSGMGGGMMGNGSGTSTTSYFWLIPATLIGITVIGGVGLAFYLAVPEIKILKKSGQVSKKELASLNPSVTSTPANISEVGADPYELISRTMTADERKVLDVLVSHDGKYLQKYIKSDTGLSRLQTHRIVARLADREIVSIKQVGNTNEVLLSDWLRTCKLQKDK